MASDLHSDLHEAASDVAPKTREMHRALASLIEELEAVDWYGQRVDASDDEELKQILVHNRDEEKEHACMTLEWIRRRDPKFDQYLRQFLFGTGPIAQTEQHVDSHDRAQAHGPDASLGIGGLRKKLFVDQEE